MPKRREQIRMTDDEITDYIAAQRDLQVATIGKDGVPHLATMWFGIHEGRVVFETYAKSQKYVNLRRDPRISVLLSSGTTYDQLCGVTISGVAELHDDADEVYPHALAVMLRNQPWLTPEERERGARVMAQKRSSVVVVPQRVASWDHRKLAGSY